MNWHAYLIILPGVFIAGAVDAIAGGGGLISIPAYMAAGLPPHFVLGNNKFSSCFGTLFATWRYIQHRLSDLPVALLSAACALVGSFAGTRTVLLLDPAFLRYVLIVLVPLITLFTLLNKRLGQNNHAARLPLRRRLVLASLASLVIGFYDGFFGPGTGSFLILFYTAVLHYDFVSANANTKVVNLASNVAALVVFLWHGKVLLAIGIPAAVCGIAGNLLGARVVLKRGPAVIRPIFLLVLAILFVKIAIDLILRR